MAARYSCTVLVSVGTVPSVSTPCALIWVTAPLHPGPASETDNAGSVGNQSETACQTPHSACMHRPIRFPQWLQTIPPGLTAVWDNIPGIATPRLHACKTDWTIEACLQSLYVSLGRSYVASATSTNCSRKLWLVRIQAVEKISLLNYSVQTQSTVGHVA